jgi:hypothetical protein
MSGVKYFRNIQSDEPVSFTSGVEDLLNRYLPKHMLNFDPQDLNQLDSEADLSDNSRRGPTKEPFGQV